MATADCFICRKHRAEIAPPPGGYLWEDKTWLVCHAPAEIAGAGTLILESRRHFLDLEDMPADDRVSFGLVLGRLYPAIRRGTGAERSCSEADAVAASRGIRAALAPAGREP